MESRLHNLRVIDTSDMDSNSDDEITFNAHKETVGRKKATQPSTSGKLRTVEHRISESIDWPHFYIYRSDSKPVTYDTLSMAEFVHGYLELMGTQPEHIRSAMNTHLKELMADASTYEWAIVRHYHSVVLSKMETGRLKWSQRGDIQDLRRQHVWSAPVSTKTTQSANGYTKTCRDFQVGKCTHTTTHNGYAHACYYCLKKTGRQYQHPEHECRRKNYGVTPPTTGSNLTADSPLAPLQPAKNSFNGGKQ